MGLVHAAFTGVGLSEHYPVLTVGGPGHRGVLVIHTLLQKKKALVRGLC